jgi:hypothetical protein
VTLLVLTNLTVTPLTKDVRGESRFILGNVVSSTTTEEIFTGAMPLKATLFAFAGPHNVKVVAAAKRPGSRFGIKAFLAKLVS